MHIVRVESTEDFNWLNKTLVVWFLWPKEHIIHN
jgi:hypothetical protein